MPEHRTGTREEWQAARDELAKLEAEQAKQNEEVTAKRLELPWVEVEKEYEFETQEGKKTLAELFDGRSQLLAYNVYKERMGWQVPYVSTYDTDFAFDFGLAMTEEQAMQIPEVKDLIDNPPDWLKEWASQVGAELKDGLRENPSWIAFARENGTVYHTYTVSAPDPFVAPYFSFLMERTPMPKPPEPHILRKDEYPAD
jgi:predicted dithiol-disulfide oxidoreductase (DUF899 family)